MTRALLILVLATLGIAVAFLVFPGIDRAVEAALLIGPDGRFLLEGVGWPRAINATVPWLIAALAGGLGVLGVCRLLGRPVGGIGWRQIAYILAVFVIGPGLLVNTLLKDHLGRARPRDVQASEEQATFTPPFMPSTACETNCSFPSGDASAAFAFIAVALVAPRRWRGAGVAGAVALGSFYGAIRMLQGAHYLSDVIFAGLLVALVAIGLHVLVFREDAAKPGGRASGRTT